MESSKKELLSSFFKRDKWRLAFCLAPGMACPFPAIRSHSLQNSQVLDLLARDGHVKALTRRIEAGTGPVFFFDDIGRNRATTFTGFCSEHDSSIFRPIEINTFQPSASEHLFLAAYRAVAKELHAMMEGAMKIRL